MSAVERSRRYRRRHPDRVRALHRDWHKRHPGANAEYCKKTYDHCRASKMSWLNERKNKPCKDCGGVFPPCVMDFDHVRGKKHREIASMWECSKKLILREIAKCDLVCSNCHRIRTWNRRHPGNQLPYNKVTLPKNGDDIDEEED